MLKSNFLVEAAVVNQSGAMEADTISKNGRNSKSHMSRRNRYSLFLFVCLFFFSTFSAHSQQSRQRIAVIDLAYSGGSYEYEITRPYAMELTGLLTTQLVNTRKYVVMERSRIQQVIRELGLQNEQNVNARAAEIGNLLGVQKIITGEYNGWSYLVNLRLIDIESGGIEASVSMDKYVRDNKGKIIKKKGVNVQMTNEEFANKLLAALLN